MILVVSSSGVAEAQEAPQPSSSVRAAGSEESAAPDAPPAGTNDAVGEGEAGEAAGAESASSEAPPLATSSVAESEQQQPTEEPTEDVQADEPVSLDLTRDLEPPVPVARRNRYSTKDRGLAIHGHFGVVGGNYLLGGGVSSPWFSSMMRLNGAFGVAFYPDALASDPDAAWTSFGHGHLRVEVGMPFLASSPIRPYAFGGLTFTVVGDKISSESFSVGGVGGLGIEAGFADPFGEVGPVTYALEFAGVGSGAEVEGDDRTKNLLSGFAASAVVRAYFW